MFSFGLIGRRKAFGPNICVIDVGIDNNLRGFIRGTMGEITPGAAYSGVLIQQATWDVSTGEFIIAFGNDGNVKPDNINALVVTHYKRPDGNTAEFNSASTDYRFNDLDLAQWINDDPERACFWVEALFDQIIDLDLTVCKTGRNG